MALQSAELAGRQQTLNGDFENFVSHSLLADKELAPWIEATELAQQQVVDSARNGDNDQAAKAASSAATHLEELSQQLQQRARQGVQQTQQQQLQQWGESIQRLIARQSRLLPEYQQLAEQVGRAEADDYPRLASRLMQAQEDIRRELRTLRTVPTETLLIFQWVLDQVDMDMAKALAATQRRRLDPEAIRSAGMLARRLKMAVAALGRLMTNPWAQGKPPHPNRHLNRRRLLHLPLPWQVEVGSQSTMGFEAADRPLGTAG